jgi:hypothetical protein
MHMRLFRPCLKSLNYSSCNLILSIDEPCLFGHGYVRYRLYILICQFVFFQLVYLSAMTCSLVLYG